MSGLGAGGCGCFDCCARSVVIAGTAEGDIGSGMSCSVVG